MKNEIRVAVVRVLWEWTPDQVFVDPHGLCWLLNYGRAHGEYTMLAWNN